MTIRMRSLPNPAVNSILPEAMGGERLDCPVQQSDTGAGPVAIAGGAGAS
jgi:hypothetical protein